MSRGRHPALLLIEYALFSLDVLEHVLVLWKHNVVRENVRVAFVKLVNSRQPLLALVVRIEAFEKIAQVVEEQVIFEDADDAGVLVVHDI